MEQVARTDKIQDLQAEKLQKVENALNYNSTLNSPEGQVVKQAILSMISKLITSFSSLSVDLLANRLETVTISATKKYTDDQKNAYDITNNQLRFTTEIEYDFENLICQELVQMAIIRTKRENAGKISDVPLDVIDAGMSQMIANYVVGNDSEKESNLEERHICNMMDQICNGQLLESFLRDDVIQIKQQVMEHNMVYVNQLAVNDRKTKHLNLPSHIAEIQKDLMTIAYKEGKQLQFHLIGNEYTFARTVPSITSFQMMPMQKGILGEENLNKSHAM